MKAQVRPAHKEDLEGIITLLHDNLDSRLSSKQWRCLFEYPNVDNQPNLGFLLESQDQLVGFLGAIYSERLVEGCVERFCNLTSWYVLPAFRTLSITLLMTLLNQQGYTFINLAPTEAVGQLMLRCGFRPLEWHKLLCGPKLYRAFVERKRKPAQGGRFYRASRIVESLTETLLFKSVKLFYEISPEPVDTRVNLIVGAELIRPMLSGLDQRLLDDHHHCGHFLVFDGKSYSYVVTVNRKIYFGRRALTDFVVSDILHVSERQLASRYWELLCRYIVKHEHSHFVTADERIVASHAPEGLRLSCCSYFLSKSGINPNQIDSLYTEVPFLDVLIYA